MAGSPTTPRGEPERGAPLRRVSWFARALDPTSGPTADPPLPPTELPPAFIARVPGRGEMFFRRGGDDAPGVPVILLHGWMASADLNWFRLFRPLMEHHPVIAPDHRGHGRGIRAPHRFSLEDCADDAAALLRHLGIERAVVVGYSMGGPVATLLWRRHPELVAGLVLQATALEWRQRWSERLRWRLMGILAFLLRWHAGRILLMRLMGESGDIPPDLVARRTWLEGEFRRADWTDVADAGRALGRYDARGFARLIDVPTAVVVTLHDHLVDPHKQLAMAEVMGARVFGFEGDHDSAVTDSAPFAAVTLRAIEAVCLPGEGRRDDDVTALSAPG